MSVSFEKMNVYGLTGTGAKIRMGRIPAEVDGLSYVGGKIFYIDESADGLYEFYDEHGDIMTNVDVGSEPYAYRTIKQGTKDKFYVYLDKMFTSKRWTYKTTDWVYESLSTVDGIGKGKSNTQTVMNKDAGAYIKADVEGCSTIWYQLKQTRDAKEGGCNDWFIPSKAEIEELRKAIGFEDVTTSADPKVLSVGKVTGGVIAGTADGQTHYKDYNTTRMCYPSNTKFLNNHMWSSSESSAQYAWFWYYYYQCWDGNSKNHNKSVFFARAF